MKKTVTPNFPFRSTACPWQRPNSPGVAGASGAAAATTRGISNNLSSLPATMRRCYSRTNQGSTRWLRKICYWAWQTTSSRGEGADGPSQPSIRSTRFDWSTWVSVWMYRCRRQAFVLEVIGIGDCFKVIFKRWVELRSWVCLQIFEYVAGGCCFAFQKFENVI